MNLKNSMRSTVLLALIVSVSLWYSCKSDDDNLATKSMQVKVTAYNSVPGQTKAIDSDIAAWGDTLRPGMKAIAVSRDLIYLGLIHGAEVSIEGLDGKYIVLDKMNSRYKKRIDVYLGLDVDSARSWGVQKRNITWQVPRESKYDKRYQYEPVDSLGTAKKKK